MAGRRVCRFHGGLTPRGVASPHWRGQGYSKDLPTRLADRYRMAVEDPELLELRSSVALVDARIGEVLASLPEEPSEVDPDTWRELLVLLEQRRKTVETERRREETLQLHMSANQAIAFVSALMTAVVECVTDLRERQALAQRVEYLLGKPGEIVVESDGDDAARDS
jgi:hypothetical protein